MKTFVLVIITSMIVILTGCTFNDSEKEIVEDVTKQQTQSTSKAEQPNNMEQNYHIQSDDNNAKALNEYADVTGTYIYSTYNHLLEIEPLFSLNNVSDSDIESAKQSATNILEEYGKYMNVEIPESFEGFQDVHSVMIYEIEQLYKALHEANSSSSSLGAARRHYENAIMSHQLMEREFLTLTDELGIY